MLSTMYYVLRTMYCVVCTVYFVLCTLYYVLCSGLHSHPIYLNLLSNVELSAEYSWA
jgi:hypothetical protein